MAKVPVRSGGMQFDRIVATCAAVAIVALVGFLLVRNQEIADPRLFFALRLILSFGVAVLGATIPGFLNVGWTGGGLTVRAGGALALFALTYLYTPDLASGSAAKPSGATSITLSAPGGVAAGEIKNSPITITNPAPANPAPAAPAAPK